jgi:hypothetical protein
MAVNGDQVVVMDRMMCPLCHHAIDSRRTIFHFEACHREELRGSPTARMDALYGQIFDPAALANALMQDCDLPFFVFLVTDEAKVRVMLTGALRDWRKHGDIAAMACWKALFITCPAEMVQRAEVRFLEDWVGQSPSGV